MLVPPSAQGRVPFRRHPLRELSRHPLCDEPVASMFTGVAREAQTSLDHGPDRRLRPRGAGRPRVRGGNLVFANPQDAQSLNETNVFDNNSIWIMEQITQPLFTVTSNGKGV